MTFAMGTNNASGYASGNIVRINSQEKALNLCTNKSLLRGSHFEPKKNIDPETGHLERFKSEPVRLGTFDSNWPERVPVSKTDLAKAGWFYTGEMDKVKCPWCQGAVYNWEKGDTAFGEHKKHFPSCPFVKEFSKRQPMAPPTGGACNMPEEPWYKMCSVRAVIDLGYERELVEKAVQSLERKKIPRRKINTDAILEELWGIETTNDANENKEHQQFEFDGTETDAVCGYSLSERTPTNSDYICDEERDIISKDNIPTTIDSASLQEEISQLQRQNEALKTNLTCKVCLEESVGDLFLPCRHLVCCVSCSASVSKCPVCRERIVGVIKVFL